MTNALAEDRRSPVPYDWLRDAYMKLLTAAEPGELREGLVDTPARAAQSWRELTCGYGDPDPDDLRTFDATHFDQIVVEKDLPFFSLCEHHALPFWGTTDIAVLPNMDVLGLSKYARIVQHYSRRLQMQERMTEDIADCIEAATHPVGTLVIVRAGHLCMQMRGVQKLGATTITSVARGRFRLEPGAKAEAMELLR